MRAPRVRPRPRPRPRLSFLSSRRLETKTLVSRTTSLDYGGDIKHGVDPGMFTGIVLLRNIGAVVWTLLITREVDEFLRYVSLTTSRLILMLVWITIRAGIFNKYLTNAEWGQLWAFCGISESWTRPTPRPDHLQSPRMVSPWSRSRRFGLGWSRTL